MHDAPLVTVVIPVWKDEEALARTLRGLASTADAEIVVAPVLGEESRYLTVRDAHPVIRWVPAPRGRAAQMNAGAAAASGRWLLFLHADSVLPDAWLNVIAQVDESTDVVAGAFRLALDSRDWRARLIETGVRLRVALLGLPYGDQALFVRSQVFRAIGGYRDLPLMEDLDLVRRLKSRGTRLQLGLKTRGRPLSARASVLTSSRRWEKDGWIRRSTRNLGLATRYLLGASPARLAQRYFHREAAALVMMARAPWTGGKTRIDVAADEADHSDLRYALFLDTLDVVTSVPNVEHIIACEPADASERLRAVVGTSVDVVAQRGADLGQRLTHVFEDVFRLGVESIVVIGSDLPDLPSRLLHEALRALRTREDRLVLGPATDGGYYLVGMNHPHPAVFDGIAWSTDRAFAQTREAAHAQGLDVVVLDRWTDIDDNADLERLMRDPMAPTATRTHAWARDHQSRLAMRTKMT